VASPVSKFRFGPYELFTPARELHKHGRKVKLRPQPYQVLMLLVERAGDVVTREQLRERVWTSDTFVDFEHGLNTAIKELRAVLSDSAKEPRYIETLPKLGYRFIAPVERPESPAAATQPAGAAAESLPAERGLNPSQPASHRRQWLVVAGFALILLVALAGSLRWSRPGSRPQQTSAKTMLAVLPFVNLTGDPGQEYFSDGLTEEMIAQLGRYDVDRLGVIARTSAMHYKHSQEPIDQIGRELGVQYVLEGSVRRDADKVRITAQLIQVKDQAHLWTRQYDRQLSGLLALQTEIAQEVSDEIHLVFGDSKRSAPHRQPAQAPKAYEAYDLYLNGRYFWNERTEQGFQQAAEYFKQAIEKDPAYARAYAGLADTYALRSTWRQVPQSEFMPMARAAALKALQLDEGLAEAHASLALIAENYDYDWQTAEEEYRRAIQLDPSYATAHQWYAECLSYQGRFDEALAESERARLLDPLSLIIATDHGEILYYSRQYDRAIDQFRTVLQMDPNFGRAHAVVSAYVQTKRFADALADIEGQHLTGLHEADVWGWEAYIYARTGRTAESRKAFRKLERAVQASTLDATPVLLVAYIGMDLKDRAFSLLEKAYSEKSNVVTGLKVNPLYDPLRSDPRFQELIRKVGL